ncbi:hypothetical protein BDZ45DRAFT_755145 [Acephala macrosclerotiorum]|nr:hypothetical protein BDZ45DRAFT_755145 [Acephala macrosclerotiorum]
MDLVSIASDYGAGFNVLTAGSNLEQKSILAATIANIITTTILPAPESQALVEAAHDFAGTYASKELNSFVVVKFNESLGIQGFERLGQIAFRAVLGKVNVPPDDFIGPFPEMQATNSDWLMVDSLTYGGIGMSLFVFDVGEDDKATALTPAATRARLERVG